MYCRLEFAGNRISSASRPVSGATFNQQLWVPVYVPTMATRVVLSMWRRGGAFGTDAPLGHHYMDISKIRKVGGEGAPSLSPLLLSSLLFLPGAAGKRGGVI